MKSISEFPTFKMLIITFVLILKMFQMSAQETKFVKNKNFDITEEYYVLKDDKEIKHGSYVKYISGFGSGFLESGSYNYGLKNGIWEYFYTPDLWSPSNKLKQRITYFDNKKNGLYTEYFKDLSNVDIAYDKKGKEKTFDIDQKSLKLRTAGIYINDNRFGRWKTFDIEGNLIQDYDFSKGRLYLDKTVKDSTQYNLNRNALFTGGEIKMVEYIIDSLKMMVIVPTIHDDSTFVKISFRIDIKGEVSECKVLESNGSKEFLTEALKATMSTSYCWIPALSEGEPVDFIYKIVYFVKRIKEESGPSRINFTCYSEFD